MFLFYLFNLGIQNSTGDIRLSRATSPDYSAVGQALQAEALGVSSSTRSSAVNTASSPKSNIGANPAPIALPYSAPPFDGSTWIYDWGTASTQNGVLAFGAASTTTGGDLFLSGADQWTDYAIHADVDWISGASFSIMARATSDLKNFVYCDFGDHSVRIVARDDGDDTTLADGYSPGGGSGAVLNFGMDVYGGAVECTINGTEVAGATTPAGSPAQGSIGLLSWDSTPGNSKIIVTNLSVFPFNSDTIIAPFSMPAPQDLSMASQTTAAGIPTSTLSVITSTPVIALSIPYSENNFSNDPNWQQAWGSMFVDGSGYLDIESGTSTTGASILLTNTDDWSNYQFSSVVDWLKGETFTVVGRYIDNNNYVSCEFLQDPANPGSVTIELNKIMNGNKATLETGQDNDFMHEGSSNIAISLSLQDTQASCSFNDHSVSNVTGNSYAVDPGVGAIGFLTWDPAPGNTEVIVKNLSVSNDY